MVAYLEKSGYGSKAAAPVVKCIFTALAGQTRDGPGAAVRPARRQLAARRHRRRSWPTLVHASAAVDGTGLSRMALSMLSTQAGLRPRQHPVQPRLARAATSTGCCCSPQAALAVIGLFVIYSASRTKHSDPYLYVTRQVVFLIGAVIAMVVVMSVDYDWLRERARFFYGVTIMLLVLVIIAGTVSGGARLSFDLGPIKLQPAEFAKATVLLALAAYLGRGAQRRGWTYPRFLGGLIMVGVPSALIIIQPDLGTASVLVAMAMGVLLVAGAKPKYIALITLMSIGTVGAAVVSGIVNDYQIEPDQGVLQPGLHRPGAARPRLPAAQRASGPSPPAASPARAGCRGRSRTPRTTSRCSGPTSRSRRSASSSA